MNTKSSLLLAGAASLVLVNAANAAAPLNVYVTGSTAARTAFFNTVNDPGVVFDAGPPALTVVGQGNAVLSKCSYMTFNGHLVGSGAGVVTQVKCHWSGSEAGIADLVGGTEQFLADGAPSAAGTPGPFDPAEAVDLAMADNDKAFSHNPGVSTQGAFVGVIPFKFIVEAGSLADIANVTDSQLRILLTGGSPAALVTGSSGDTTWVYISGRDNNSGTRNNCYGDCKYGRNSAGFQLQVDAGGVMHLQSDGNYVSTLAGYSSGGTLAAQMGVDLSQAGSQDLNTGTGLHYSVIAYLGYDDSVTALGLAGVREITYNGVAESTAAIREGEYDFWGNEFLYGKPVLSSQAQSVFNILSPAATGINHHADNLGLIDKTTMNCTRGGPDSDPIHN